MEFHRFGDGSDPPLLFVLGWGNRPEHRPVRWLIDHLAGRYRVHTATLPVHVIDVKREWARAVEAYAADLEDYRVLAHSAGGLTVAHADLAAGTTTYLSPWWGEPPERRNALVRLVARVPGNLRFLPSKLDDGDVLGTHATD